MSRPLCSVSCEPYVVTSTRCSMSTARPLIMSRPRSSRDIISRSSSINGCLTWSFCCDLLVLPSVALMLRLEFCGCDLDVILHHCQGVDTIGPFFLVHFSCCDIIQPVVSFLLSQFLLLLLQYPLSLEFPAA